MKIQKRLFILIGWVALILLLPACASPIKASLNSQVTLAPGQTARIETESLDIKFIGVAADSRCPDGVQCIRAGDVTCDIEITLNGKTEGTTIKDEAGSGLSQGYVFDGYVMNFSVTPYPRANLTIKKSDYRLSLTMHKLAPK